MEQKEFKISSLPDKVFSWSVIALMLLYSVQPYLEEQGILVGYESLYDILAIVLIYLCIPVIVFVEVLGFRKALNSGDDAACRAGKRRFATVSVLLVVLAVLTYMEYFVV